MEKAYGKNVHKNEKEVFYPHKLTGRSFDSRFDEIRYHIKEYNSQIQGIDYVIENNSYDKEFVKELKILRSFLCEQLADYVEKLNDFYKR